MTEIGNDQNSAVLNFFHSDFGFVWNFVIGIWCFCLVSCAGQVPPSGGPLDTDPPVIISVYPAPNTTFFHDSRIAFEFDEYVDRRSFEESVFISPFVGPLEFDWSGTEVEIAFSERLRENTTYVVTVGTDVVDTRNKNRMAEAFILAFATGGEIDRGGIDGTVYSALRNDPAAGVMVFAYRLDGLNPDTLDPQSSKPDYITQTGKSGKFSFRHLSFGAYRLFAIRDEYKNLLYDPETDEIGISQADMRLSDSDTLRTGLLFRLAREDTTAPRLVKVDAIHERMIVAEFSKNLDIATIRSGAFLISDTAGIRSFEVSDVAPAVPKLNSVFVLTERPFENSPFRLTVQGVRDSVGHEISPLANSLDFIPLVVPDTVAPELRWLPPDSSRSILLMSEVQVTLSEPVRSVDWGDVVQLRDSLNRPVATVGGWNGSAGISFRPEHELAGLSWYRLLIRQGILEDYSGNRPKDTVLTVSFETLDADRFSSIEGTVVDWNQSDTAGAILLRASNIGRRDAASQQIKLETPGSFVFGRLLEGSYVLDAFRDSNNNGMYDAGKSFPFVASERFVVHPDTLKLRARWPLEGVRIELR
ncbi:MAG: Ig-like domain-containing protein [Ignavibacteriales bacterium]|nr:Ig-like domain-containing protein [Ignavibacteriales bacterium]